MVLRSCSGGVELQSCLSLREISVRDLTSAAPMMIVRIVYIRYLLLAINLTIEIFLQYFTCACVSYSVQVCYMRGSKGGVGEVSAGLASVHRPSICPHHPCDLTSVVSFILL